MTLSPPKSKSPLNGFTVGITGSRRASELAKLVSTLGGRPYIAPTVGIDSTPNFPKDTKRFINNIIAERVDYAIFMTGPGVYSLMSVAKESGLDEAIRESLQNTTIIARSAKPKMALAKHGLTVDLIPEENTSEGISIMLNNYDIKNKKIAIIWHGSYSNILKKKIQSAGAQIIEITPYNYSLELKDRGSKILKEMRFRYIAPNYKIVTNLIEDICKGRIHIITFTSPPSIRNFFRIAEEIKMNKIMLNEMNIRIIVVAVGLPSKKTLEAYGVKVDVMPEIYKMGHMVKAMGEYINNHGLVKSENLPALNQLLDN